MIVKTRIQKRLKLVLASVTQDKTRVAYVQNGRLRHLNDVCLINLPTSLSAPNLTNLLKILIEKGSDIGKLQ